MTTAIQKYINETNWIFKFILSYLCLSALLWKCNVFGENDNIFKNMSFLVIIISTLITIFLGIIHYSKNSLNLKHNLFKLITRSSLLYIIPLTIILCIFIVEKLVVFRDTNPIFKSIYGKIGLYMLFTIFILLFFTFLIVIFNLFSNILTTPITSTNASIKQVGIITQLIQNAKLFLKTSNVISIVIVVIIVWITIKLFFIKLYNNIVEYITGSTSNKIIENSDKKQNKHISQVNHIFATNLVKEIKDVVGKI